jgi:hypothetical protein
MSFELCTRQTTIAMVRHGAPTKRGGTHIGNISRISVQVVPSATIFALNVPGVTM